MVDPFMPPHPQNIPLDGDGHISAFRFHNGRVDMKTRYVETERYKLERRANKAMFGLYRNPYTHHPCVRAAIDSTANTNLVYWAGHLLALKEGGLPYAVDPNTLETLKYDPFGQVKAKTFSAHPKYDPFTDELVVFGYEATGLASNDVVSYNIDRKGKISNEFWYKQPWEKPGTIHDCAISKDWHILFIWPFDADIERMKRGGHHWAWNYDRKMTLLVAPRNPANPPATSGWKPHETRYYEWHNCMPIHTSAAWQDANVETDIWVESSRVHDNAFPFFPPESGRMPPLDTKADFVKWRIDVTKPSGTMLEDPSITLNVASEFPRIDERFMTKEYEWLWANVHIGKDGEQAMNIFHGLNGLVMHNNKTSENRWYYAGDDSNIQEPIFIPRSEREGDGWVMALIERKVLNRCDIVILDTKDFERPLAIVQLPFHMKAQVHGNWVGAKELGGHIPLARSIPDFEMINGGALEPL